ncbi:VWA domain-containing protein [bacterium]|nr:VWA domain-containing protein [bacterium]
MNLKQAFLIGGCIVAALTPLGLAGNGTYVARNGRKYLNLTVSFKGAISLAEIDRWKANFEATNDRLFRATLGQIQLGDIRLARDAFSQRRADVIIERSGHAHVTGDVVGASLGTNEQLFVYTAEDIDAPNTTTHELGHYLFGLWDEYKGDIFGLQGGVYQRVDSADANSESVFCTTKGENSSLASLMWNSTDMPELAHFCVGANHQKDIDIGNGRIVRSAQQIFEGRECWASVAQYAGITAPAGPPTFNDKAPDKPQFVQLGMQACTVYLIQQTSGLTLQSTKLTISDGLGRLRGPKGARTVGDFAGVMTYNANGVTTNLSVREFRTAAQRKAAITLVKGIPTSNVSDGDAAQALRDARDAINAAEVQFGTPFAAKTIVLFSDGRGADGLDEALIQEMRVDNIGVNVAELVGQQNDKLETLSARTLGRHAPALVRRPRAKALGKVLAKLDDQNTEQDQAQSEAGSGILGSFRLDGFEGDVDISSPKDHSFSIDSFVESVSFQLDPVYDEESPTIVPLRLEIRDPAGHALDLDNPPANAEITVSEEDSTMVRIDAPTQGVWSCRVSAPGDPGRYSLNAFAEGEPLLTSNSSDSLKGKYPSATPLRVKLGTEQNIIGADVTGKVFRPDGSELAVTFYDDGDAAHDDEIANDGIYSLLFNDYAGPGDYLVSILAKGNANTQFTTLALRGESLHFQPGASGPCPGFQREINLAINCAANTGVGSGLLPLDDFQILSGSDGRVTLRWRNPNPGGSSVVVQRTFNVAQWADLITLPIGVNEFTDLNAGSQGNVFYRVLAQGAAGLSFPTNFEQLDLKAVSQAFRQGEFGRGGTFTGADTGGFCFVATAAYGSFLDPHVQTLRRYRDEQLRPLPGGQKLVEVYYKLSPPAANFLTTHPWAKPPARLVLTLPIAVIEHPYAASCLVLVLGLGLLTRHRHRSTPSKRSSK